jgi:hypothetical protein
MIDSESLVPIFLHVKVNQRVFNGYGAQEACDMLSRTLIHPIMPSALVFKDEALFCRFQIAVITYQLDQLKLAIHPKLSLLSGPQPFHMNSAAHKLYLQNILCSPWARVTVDSPTLA